MTHFLHPFSAPAKPEGDFIDIVRGEGSTIWSADGTAYLDAMASLWLCQVGHGRREINDAITAQLGHIASYNTFDPFTNAQAAQVAEMIAIRSPHPDGRVFLGTSGSEAIDTVLKLARAYHQVRGDIDRQVIVRRTGGYHGTNFGGTSAQGLEANRLGWGDLVPHFVEVPTDDIEAAASVFAEHGERIAAVLTEPVQGAGGVWPPAPGYLEGLRRLCDQHGALLIFDEVICGFGRTGEWFGSQTFGVRPDLLTFAKGVTSGYVPLSGVVTSSAVGAVLDEVPKLLHGYTYSGHALACAAGIANIEVLEAEELPARAKHIGERLSAGLHALVADGVVESVRGIGAIWAVDTGRDSVPLRNAALDHGVILRPIGNALCMCPPLVITDAEIDRIVDTIDTVVRA